MKASRKPKGYHQSIPRNSDRHREVATQAAELAGAALEIFERHKPGDMRPRLAIEAIRAWAAGERELGMVVVRKLALDAHAAARECELDSARFVARAAGHAVATWHCATHHEGVPLYLEKARKAIIKEASTG